MAITVWSLTQWIIISAGTYMLVILPLYGMLFGGPQLSRSTADYESFEKVSTLVRPDQDFQCPEHLYQINILSRAPLVIHIPNFLSVAEREHVIDAGEAGYQPSPVYHGAEAAVDQKVRNSSRAMLPRSDVIQCIEKRALDFQGWPTDVFVERMWAQKYETGGHYVHHFDYSGSLKTRGAGRLSTFMVYVACDGCVGGGTDFPRLSKPAGQEWCNAIECSSTRSAEAGKPEKGVVFKPIPGSAIFWENFNQQGTGWDELWHSGMAVKKGIKVGLNLWSWYQPGYTEFLRKKTDQTSRDEKKEL